MRDALFASQPPSQVGRRGRAEKGGKGQGKAGPDEADEG